MTRQKIDGAKVRKVLSVIALDPGATADEKRWLGNFTYHLTGKTADRIAALLEA